MMAKELATFLLAFCLAGGIINSMGIFTPVENININPNNVSGNGATELMDVDSGTTQSATDVSTTVDSWGLLVSTFSMVTKMLSVLVLPGPFLKGIGVNALFADAVQVIFNVTLAWGLIQMALNRTTKQMD